MLDIVHMKDSQLTKGHDSCSIKMTSPKKKGCQIELWKSLAPSLWRSGSLKSCDLHPVFQWLSVPCELRRWIKLQMNSWIKRGWNLTWLQVFKKSAKVYVPKSELPTKFSGQNIRQQMQGLEVADVLCGEWNFRRRRRARKEASVRSPRR